MMRVDPGAVPSPSGERAVKENAFIFEDYTVDVRRAALYRGDREIDLRPKSFEVLRYLVANAGRLVSKDELSQAIWPTVVASDESLTRCVSDVRQALADGERRIIKTVPRRGYLFAASVSMRANTPASAKANTVVPRRSLVVLPFSNLGGGEQWDDLVDCVTLSLTTDLSQVPGLLVMARSTALNYKGKAVDARQVGRELGVRYIIDGNAQIGGDRIRITAELIDADTGAQLWGDRFDKPLDDPFAMQDEITARLFRTLGIELAAAESRRACCERPKKMDAVDLAMRGWTIANRPYSIHSAEEARKLFERSLAIDGANVDALVGLASTHIYAVTSSAAGNQSEHVRIADAAISKALAISPNSAHAYYLSATISLLSGAPERTLRQCERAIDLDCNHAWAHALAGLSKIWLGRAEDTEAHVAKALRLNPREPQMFHWHLFIGIADLCLARFDRAVDRVRCSIDMNPNFATAWYYLAAALALAGRETEAAEASAAGCRRFADFTVSRFRSRHKGINPTFQAQRERIIEGLRRARVPEQ
jgi:TolB-like protein